MHSGVLLHGSVVCGIRILVRIFVPDQAGVVDASGIGRTKDYGGPCHNTKTAFKPEESVSGFISLW